MTPRLFPSVPIEGGAEGTAEVVRADIVVWGLDHGGPSFEVRIFLGNPDADAGTPPTRENGYAESIHVYGMGMPAGGDGDGADAGPPPLRKTRSVIATDAVRAAAAAGSEVDVTLVAVPAGAGEPHPDLGGVGVAVRAGEPPEDAVV